MMVIMIFCWDLWEGFSLKIENLHFAFLAISLGTVAVLGSSHTYVHDVATCDFASLSGCTQLVYGSNHRAGVIFD